MLPVIFNICACGVCVCVCVCGVCVFVFVCGVCVCGICGVCVCVCVCVCGMCLYGVCVFIYGHICTSICTSHMWKRFDARCLSQWVSTFFFFY